MINHNITLRDQLKKVVSLTNKKYTTLRKQIQKTCQVFDSNIPVFPYQVCFRLFHEIIDTGSLTTTIAIMPFLQRIINTGFANQEMSKQIIQLLMKTKCIPKFATQQNQQRIQQILMLLISKNAINLTKIQYTYSIINILFALDNHKYRIIWCKTYSTLSQILIMFINQLIDQNNLQKIASFDLFLVDIINIVTGKIINIKWLTETAEIYILYNLLSQILQQKYFIIHNQKYHMIFQGIFIPIQKLINKIYRTNIDIFIQTSSSPTRQNCWELSIQSQLIILIKTACKVSKFFKQNFEILEIIVKMLAQNNNNQFKYIAYESVVYLFSSYQWMHSLIESTSQQLFNFLMTTQFNIIKHLTDISNPNKLDYISQKNNFAKIYHHSALDLSLIQLTTSLQIRYIIKNIEQITMTLYSIYTKIYEIQLDNKFIGPKIPIQKTYKFTQKIIFQIIKSIISKQMSQEILQSILKISQKFINLSGVFNDNQNSIIYIKLLCKYCLPINKIIDYRHVQINKMILNIANCLGNLFNTTCWIIFWKTFENYTSYYNRYKLQQQQLQSSRQTDVQILYQSMDSIFTQSKNYTNSYLIIIIRSLIQVNYQYLENHLQIDQNKKIFTFQRIQQIYKLNLFRISLIWPQISTFLICIITSKINSFRNTALKLLNTLLPLSLYHLYNYSQVITLPLCVQNYQNSILQPWVNLSQQSCEQIKKQLAITLNKLIIDYGHILNHGWSSIMLIIKKTRDLKALQAIVQTFLEKVDILILDFLNTIDEIQHNLIDSNKKYLCLTLIWAIADHCQKQNKSEILIHIYNMLLKPDQMFMLDTQARHSSFYIFAQIIVHNCTEQNVDFWKELFVKIKNFYNYALQLCQQHHQTFYEQAIKNIIVNLIKIYRKFYLTAHNNAQFTELMTQNFRSFYIFCSKVLKFKQAQIYQSLLKQIRQFLQITQLQSIIIDEFYLFIDTITSIYVVENDNKILKCLISYLPVDLYDIINKCIISIDLKKFNSLYKLAQKIFLLRLQAQQKDMQLNKMRIFFQERQFNQFWKILHTNIMNKKYIKNGKQQQLNQIKNNQINGIQKQQQESIKNINQNQSNTNIITTQVCNTNQMIINEYLIKLCMTLHKLILYEDYSFLSRMLPYLSSIIEQKGSQVQFILALQLIQKIIKLRQDSNWISIYGKSKQVPIWYIGTQELIKCTYKLIKQNNINIYQYIYTLMFQLSLSFISDKQIKLIYSSQIIYLLYDSQSYIISFFVQNLLLQSSQNNQQIQKHTHQIGTILLRCSKQNHCTYNYSYQILFKFTNNKSINQQTNILSIKAILIQYLFQKILITFDNYFISLQQQNNNLSQYEQQLEYILKKMLILQLNQGILQYIEHFLSRNYVDNININSLVLIGPYAHLFYFNNSFIKCIKCSSEKIRNLIAQLLGKASLWLLNK